MCAARASCRLSIPLLAAVALAAAGCAREQRRFNEVAAWSSPAWLPPSGGLRLQREALALTPTAPLPFSFYDGNAWAVSQGKRGFDWFNCSGCHAQGGGGGGPPLMDHRWRYGSSPAAIFTSIVGGRPNGMPAYGGKLVEQQVWQLVAYVRALGGLVRLDVQPGRSDALSGRPPEAMLVHPGAAAAPDHVEEAP